MTHKERNEEVREILALGTDELVKRAKGQLVLFPTRNETTAYLCANTILRFVSD